ncbi:hypothetical protein [Granulicella sp. L60]|uniref:hypothetical protein n=1 Tax=Granulicella sp. L60 TaxID=1641866 RepID=UPI00131AB28D|nr:hypothetical protein [Granulicella sp. L60]
MSKFERIRLIVALSTGLIAGSLLAQTSSEDQTSTSAQSPAEVTGMVAENSVQDSKGREEEQMQYAAALNGSGLISMEGSMSSHLLLGATVAGGWDSNPDSLGNGMSSGVYTLSPYLGIQANTAKMQVLLQYQPLMTGYSSDVYSNQTMHMASFAILGNVNERWKWELKGTGSYGQDSTRLLAPQQTVVVGEVSGAGPNSASYIPNAGTITYIDGGLEVHYKESERDSIEFRVANSFNQYSGFSSRNSIATTSLSYNRDLSSTLGLFAYGRNSYYYGSFNCSSFGGGLGLRWQALEKTSLSLSGGPQLDTAACGNQQGFSYNAAFSTRLSDKSQIYLLAAREPATSYLGPGLWLISTSGGYQRQVVTTATLSLDLGYVSSNTLTTTNSYHDIYFDCIYNHSLGHGLSISYSYRGYVGDTGETSFRRNAALFSIAWSPNAGKIFQ